MSFGNLGGHSAGDIAKYLQGLNFPAQKEDVVQHAQSHQADNQTLDLLRKIPPGAYNSIADVMTRLGLPAGAADIVKGFGDKPH